MMYAMMNWLIIIEVSKLVDFKCFYRCKWAIALVGFYWYKGSMCILLIRLCKVVIMMFYIVICLLVIIFCLRRQNQLISSLLSSDDDLDKADEFVDDVANIEEDSI